MTEQEIIKGNKLIAEFMGVAYDFSLHGEECPDAPYCTHYYTVQYNHSWDWLMPVVEKIEPLGCIVEIWMSLGSGCRINKPVTKINSWSTTIESNYVIESVYMAVVEFIKWYKQTNSK